MSGDPPQRPANTASGPLRFGPFWLDSRIAVGGSAEVYLARPIDPNASPKRLIVKRLLPHVVGDAEGRTMFDREAKLHTAVTHENVVTVFGAGANDEGEPYLAMEYIEGVDGYRLLRRLRQEVQYLPVGVAVYITREVLHALDSVHSATDKNGTPLGIIHRDVTPSNIYMSKDGRVKLGDFGIARSTTRTTMKGEASAVLKGKFAYLAPEQVAGEAFDHRADLFSMATVLAEMLLNKPLFPGGGQLAVLLAIRDCRIDALQEIEARLPVGMYDVVERALSRDPRARYQTAGELAKALEPFAPDPMIARKDLAALVGWVQSKPSSDAMKAVRESMRSFRAVAVAQDVPLGEEEVKTGEYGQLPSFVETMSGQKLGPWTFARLVEAVATGQVGRGDRVDYIGRGMKAIVEIEELQRFLPACTATTNQLEGPGAPDFHDNFTNSSMLEALLRVLEGRETGVLFVERPADGANEAQRKELYFVNGKLHHVASSNSHELLGEYLVRRGKLGREELDLALAVLPRYNGRIGDTLIALGLMGAVDLFKDIRAQGRDRVADLFLWKVGSFTFYRGQAAPHVEFPLDLDLPSLLLAGLESAHPVDAPMETYRSKLGAVLGPGPCDRPALQKVAWPPSISRIEKLATPPKELRDLLRSAMRGTTIGAGDILRSIEILLAARLIAWQ